MAERFTATYETHDFGQDGICRKCLGRASLCGNERCSKNFGTMDPQRQREIARQGGLAAQASGKGRRWTTEEARDAGRKGGKVQAAIPGRMRELGRRGAARRKAKEMDPTT